MRLAKSRYGHLTYCSNIHPGETWDRVRDNLGHFLPLIKGQIAPEQEFGIGLRLSAAAADTLREPAVLAEFQDVLATAGLYVFTLNGFPYGPFHGTRVKEEVYLPDWQDEERLRYSNTLADLLLALLPPDPALEGSISTVPGAFKPWATTAAARERISELLLRHVAHLATIRARSGRTIVLALEPEPCCLLETADEVVAFFENHVFTSTAPGRLMSLTGLSKAAAEAALRRHLGVCLDLCHAAVEFEEPHDCLALLRAAGIHIAKVQISAGLRIPVVSPESAQRLRPFAEGVYLHQVVERDGNRRLRRYVDLPEALDQLSRSDEPREWRVHFHVPIFHDDLGPFSSTQPFIREMLALHRVEPIAPHLEVETYTWDVLPEHYRGEPVENAIVRELNWVRTQLDP